MIPSVRFEIHRRSPLRTRTSAQPKETHGKALKDVNDHSEWNCLLLFAAFARDREKIDGENGKENEIITR